MAAMKMTLTGDIRSMTRVATHPGVMLRAEFLEPLGLSASGLAKELDIPANRLTEVVAGRRSVTADTALRLADRFGTSPEFWILGHIAQRGCNATLCCHCMRARWEYF